MLCNIPVPSIAPPKNIAPSTSRTVGIIPATPDVETSESSNSLPVVMPVDVISTSMLILTAETKPPSPPSAPTIPGWKMNIPARPVSELKARVRSVRRRMAIMTAVSPGITRIQGVILKHSSRARVIPNESAAPIPSEVNPTKAYTPRATSIAGAVVMVRKRICLNRSTPVDEEARTVVSLSGETLSPKYAPEMIAPAIQPGLYPITVPIPMNATPMVAIVVQEVPVTTDTTAHTIHATGRNTWASSISSP